MGLIDADKTIKKGVSKQEICNWFYENYPNAELIVLL